MRPLYTPASRTKTVPFWPPAAGEPPTTLLPVAAPAPQRAGRISLYAKILIGSLVLAFAALGIPRLVRLLGLTPGLAVALELLLAIGLALALAQAMTWVLAGIRVLNGAALEISRGDLSRPVFRPRSLRLGRDEIDELAKAIGEMQQNLRELVSHIQNTAKAVADSAGDMLSWAEDVNGSTEEVALAASHIAKGAEDQRRSVQQSSGVIEAIARSIRTTADSSLQAAQAAQFTAETAEASGAQVSQAAEKVRKVFASIESASGQVFAFGEKTQEIGKIVEAITAVAQQTNMLALNATIEAARAGEAGRGFAVVAEEVRKLAERAQGSAEQISRLAIDLAGQSGAVVSAMREGIAELAEGREELSAILGALGHISTTARTGAQKVEAITASTEDQRENSQEMVQAIGHISGVADANAIATDQVLSTIREQTRSVGQMTSSAQELTNVALELQSVVSRFKL